MRPPRWAVARRGPHRRVPAGRTSQPPPAQLTTACVLHLPLRLSDRQATKAVHRHTDFHYALATELDNPGFHHSVLTNFRTRPTDDNHADHLLDPARRHASRKPG
ncbi:transposase [Streptomyces sp. OM5714]|uniref:transposase n=1 Tax=Streptomyces sp. OM5714 TaxID=2602736 RepID=UPI0013DCD4D2|nr:transposase [Streptomyces sp. OM5714]